MPCSLCSMMGGRAGAAATDPPIQLADRTFRQAVLVCCLEALATVSVAASDALEWSALELDLFDLMVIIVVSSPGARAP